jgi:hypothetical protein
MQHGRRRRPLRTARSGRFPRLSVAAVVLVGNILTASAPTSALTTWGQDDAVQVVSVNVSEAGARTGVVVSWPAPSGDADGFELRRNGVAVAVVDGSTFTAADPAPPAGAITYTVVATLGGVVDAQLPPATVAFPGPTPTGVSACTLLWTGAASQSWHDPRNWAPYGLAGSEGAVRTPTTSDTVCVDHQAAVPIEVTGAGATALAVVGTQGGTAPLRMVSGDLTVTQPSIIPAIELLGGRLDLRADTRMFDSNRPTLLLGGGHLVLGGTLTGQTSLASNIVGGTVAAVPGTTTVLDGGRLLTRALDLDRSSSVAVEGRNGHLTTVLGRTAMSGAATFATGAGGATLHTWELAATGGTNQIDWALAGGSSGETLQVNVQAGETRLTDLVDVEPAAGTLSRFAATVDGTLLLDADIQRIDTVALRGAGQLRVGGRPGNLEGIIEATSLSLEGTPPITLTGALRAAQVRVDGGSELTVPGALDSYQRFELTSAELRDGRLDVRGGWTTTDDASVRIVGTPQAPFVVEGDATLAGYVDAAYYEDPFDPQFDVPAYGATFTGDVTLPGSSTLGLSVTTDPADQPELTVEGALTVEGRIVVTVPLTLPETFERRLLAAPARTADGADGSQGVDRIVAPVEVVVVDFDGEEVPGIRVEERPDGIYAVRSEPAPPCTLEWSGAVSTAWDVPGNWTPVGGGEQRIPSLAEHACVPQTEPTSISITGTPASAGRLTGPQADLDLAEGSLTAGDVVVRTLVASPGTVSADAVTAGEIDLRWGSRLTADSVTLAGDVPVPALAMRVATLTVPAGEIVRVPATGVAIFENEVTFEGSLEVAGLLGLGLEQVDSGGLVATVSGDLRLLPGSVTQVLALEGGEVVYQPPTVIVGGALELGGDLTVDVGFPLPEGYEWPLLVLADADAGSVSGSFDTITITGESEGVWVEVLPEGVLLRRGDGAPGAWGLDALPQVRGLTVGDTGNPLSVTVTWPDPVAPFVGFELRRDGAWVASGGPEVRQLTDSSAVVGPAVYTVVGLSADGTESAIATAPVVVPADPTCSIAWVGTAGDRWHDQRNWAPMGVATLGGEVRVPTADDHVCIPTGARVLIADTAAVAGRITGIDAELAVTAVGLTAGDVTLRSLEIAGGSSSVGALVANAIDVTAGGTLRTTSATFVGDAPRLSLTDGEVGAGVPIVVTDGLVTLDGTSTVAAALELSGTTALLVGTSDLAALIGIERDLTLAPNGSAAFSVDPTRLPAVFVEGDATLDGTLAVDIATELPDPFEWALLVAESQLVGTFDDIALTGATAGARVEILPGAVGLLRSSPRWAADDGLQVTGVAVDGDGDLVSVGLSWPSMSSLPSGFEVVRTALGVDTVIGAVDGDATSFVDTDPLPDAGYSVRALVEGVEVGSLGGRRVVFPVDGSCSLLWTRSSDGSWGDERNWAPFGVAGSVGVVRVPSAVDHVCRGFAGFVEVDGPAVAGRVSMPVSGIRVVAGLEDDSPSGVLTVSGALDAWLLYADGGRVVAGSVSSSSLLVARGSISAPVVELVFDAEVGSFNTVEFGLGVVDGDLVTAPGTGVLVSVFGAVQGDLTVGGELRVSWGSQFDVYGELVWGSGSETTVRVDPQDPSGVLADGVVLAGELVVDVASELPEGFETRVIGVTDGGAVVGAFDSMTVTGAVTGARLETRPDGIHLVQGVPVWGEDDGLQVTGVTVDDLGDLVSVGLSWPQMSLSPESFEIVRIALGSETVIGTVAGDVTSFLDDDPLPDASYRVDAVGGGAKLGSLGGRRVVFPVDGSCSLLWTRSSDGSWSDERNWAPFGVAGSVGVVRVPSAVDHVCRGFAGFVEVDGPAVAGRVSMPVSGIRVVAGLEDDSPSGVLTVSGALDAWLLYADGGRVVAGSVSSSSLLVARGSISAPVVELVFDAEVGSFNTVEFGLGVVDGDLVTAPGTGVLVSVFGAVQGDLTVGGELRVSWGSQFDVYGELVWGSGSETTVRVDPQDPSGVLADGVVLAGELVVDVASELPEGFETRVIGVTDGGAWWGRSTR